MLSRDRNSVQTLRGCLCNVLQSLQSARHVSRPTSSCLLSSGERVLGSRTSEVGRFVHVRSSRIVSCILVLCLSICLFEKRSVPRVLNFPLTKSINKTTFFSLTFILSLLSLHNIIYFLQLYFYVSVSQAFFRQGFPSLPLNDCGLD